MSNTAANIIIGLTIIAVLIGGGIALQIFLSKREAKWPGLILPIITLLISLIAVGSVAVFQSFSGGVQTIGEGGEVIREITQSGTTKPVADTAQTVFTVVYVFVLYNIPTAVLIAIYAACRGKLKRQKALGKMAAQDLE